MGGLERKLLYVSQIPIPTLDSCHVGFFQETVA